jgi:hypothetical protein
MATVDDVRAIAMSLPRTSEHPKKVRAAYLQGRGL